MNVVRQWLGVFPVALTADGRDRISDWRRPSEVFSIADANFYFVGEPGRSPVARHNDRCNLLYLDGRVASKQAGAWTGAAAGQGLPWTDKR